MIVHKNAEFSTSCRLPCDPCCCNGYLIGPIGPTGPAGRARPQRKQGVQGPAGDTEATGATGPTGPASANNTYIETGTLGTINAGISYN
ncbi:hypothetical protein SDC9_65710 [bioreactor metagenome]|uniref:Collagen-like protein n=1 Tax=bioreactor metagenome TaxID=1076179 RepID=A0A644XT79_9ZZZZ